MIDEPNWRFGDRLEEETYGDEEPVEIGIDRREPGRGVVWLARMPESLVARCIHLGSAYSLHLVPLIEIYGRTTFNKQQCQNMIDEFMFIRQRIDDPLLAKHIDRWIEVMQDCVRHPREGAELVIEGP